jgi:hypothetical protein
MLLKIKLLIFAVILLGLLAPLGHAQETHEHHHADGEKLGQVHFPVSCDASLQDEFDRAVAMLHSFWYERAAEAFAEIARKDPSCAMAHWGLAMTVYHPLWEKPGAEALRNGSASE